MKYVLKLEAFVFILGFLLGSDLLRKIGLLFFSHSTFDRVAGYGLKYVDNFDQTLLGWIGEIKHLHED
jgi:Domain of unknown function (DUF4260)